MEGSDAINLITNRINNNNINNNDNNSNINTFCLLNILFLLFFTGIIFAAYNLMSYCGEK